MCGIVGIVKLNPEEDTATGLASGSHTLVIEVTGTSNPSSSSTFLGVGAFDVTS
jgi:hypothetical protein